MVIILGPAKAYQHYHF